MRIPAADLPPGSSAAVEAFGTMVALFNVDGRLYALDNRCPHYGGPLCHGRVSGALLPSDQYRYDYDAKRLVLTCPWHGWQFELESGRAVFDPRVWVPVFDVRLEGDEIVLAERSRS